jgi:hypothetical protein
MNEQEHVEEAERLKRLDRATQRRVIDGQRRIAGNPKVPKADRRYAAERADALERLLELRKEKR